MPNDFKVALVKSETVRPFLCYNFSLIKKCFRTNSVITKLLKAALLRLFYFSSVLFSTAMKLWNGMLTLKCTELAGIEPRTIKSIADSAYLKTTTTAVLIQ